MRWLLGLVVSVLALLPAEARARERPVIVTLLSTRDMAVFPRLQAELTAAGFDVRLRQAARWPTAREDAERVARTESAIAALAFIPCGESACTEIWIIDRVTGKTTIRRVQQRASDDLDMLAISAVETLRATLMEVEMPAQARGEVAPPPAVRELIAAERRRFAARVSVAGSAGGVGTSASLGLAALVAVHPRARLGVEGLIPVTSAGLEGPEGRAEIRTWLAGPLFEVIVTNPTAPMKLALAGGAWLAVLDLGGAAPPPYVGKAIRVATWAPHADVALELQLTQRMALAARISTALAVREPVIRFAGRDAASWGRPLALAALGVNIWLY